GRSVAGVSGRVAAVCPYIQVPAGGRPEADLSPKHTPLGQTRSHSANDASWLSISKSASDWNTARPEQQPSGYGTYPSATHQAAGNHIATSSLPRSAPGTLSWRRVEASKSSSSSRLLTSSSSFSSSHPKQRISTATTPTQSCNLPAQSSPLTLPPQGDRQEPPPAAAVRPYVPEQPFTRP
ncbi:hypothetical protein CRUP_008059, partial [Coryphaenoides rupestris]